MKTLKKYIHFLIVVLTASIAHGNATDDLLKALQNTDITVQQIQALIEAGADVNAHDKNGQSILMFASKGVDDDAVLKALVSSKIDVKAQNTNSLIELCINARNKYRTNPSIIRELIRAGANVNAKDNFNNTALILAAQTNPNPEIIKVLIEAGADVNAKDYGGMTPLILAASTNSNPEIVKFFISNGYDVNAKDEYGNTLLMWAAQNNSNPEVVKALIQLGADVNAKNEDDNTALIYAVKPKLMAVYAKKYFTPQSVKFIIAKADIFTRNNEGKTVWDYAETDEMKSIILKASEPYITKVKEQIFSLEQALALYRLHNGFYPSTEQGLQALLKAPTNSPIPNHYQEGGYIKSIPQDVWGKPYIYRNYGDEIQIISYGLDGKEGGEGINSDITNIEKSELTTNNKNRTSPKFDYVELNPKVFKTEDDREAQATENAYAFEKKIIELANQISSSNQYSYQDMELVESNTMVADEIVYMRAWQGKGYFFIRNYENKSWSKNQLTHFYLNDKSNVNFSGRIKIGCTLDDLTAVFGDKLEWSGSDRSSEWTLTTRSEWIMNFYISSKGYVHEIQYTTVGSITSKMSLLYAFNSGELLAADVSGQKVNVRDYPDTSGTNVVFQVNKSKKDVLLVIDNANSHYHAVYNNINEGWYRVVGRISGNKFIPVEGEAYVIYKYIDIRPMTNVERNMVSSALN